MAGDFGLLVVLMSVLLLATGFAINVGLQRGLVSMRTRRRAGVVAVALACLVPLVAFTSVALSGNIDDRVSRLTSETEVSPDEGGARVFASSSTRGKYWREAGRVFEDRPAVGVGAGAFAVARLRHRTDAAVTAHAHGFLPQTLADLGIAGVVLTLLLLFAWLAAALRTTAVLPRRLPYALPSDEPSPRRDWDRRSHRPRGAVDRGNRVRRAVDDRLDLVHPRPCGAGARGGRLRGGPRPGRSTARDARPLVTTEHDADRRSGGRGARRTRARVGGLAARGLRPRHGGRARARRRGALPGGDREDARRRGDEPARPPSHCSSGPRSRLRRATRRQRATRSSEPCSPSPETRTPGTGWPPSSSAR